MFVYAKDREQQDNLCCITMEECKASPWRWEFVKVSPGQEVVEPLTVDDYDGPQKKVKRGAAR